MKGIRAASLKLWIKGVGVLGLINTRPRNPPMSRVTSRHQIQWCLYYHSTCNILEAVCLIPVRTLPTNTCKAVLTLIHSLYNPLTKLWLYTVHVYIYIYTCVYIYLYMHTHTLVMHMQVCKHVQVSMQACKYVGLWICKYASILVYRSKKICE